VYLVSYNILGGTLFGREIGEKHQQTNISVTLNMP